MLPLVSVIVVTYNSEKYVIETLESIGNQSYQDIELVITDDYSSDSTIEICRKWVEANKSRFVSTSVLTFEENTGIAANCNRGWKIAKGEWIKIIAGDDALEPSFISELSSFALKNSDVGFVYCNQQEYFDVFDEKNRKNDSSNGAKVKIRDPFIKPSDQFNILLRCNPIPAPTVLLKRSVLEEVGGFDERYPLFEDRPCWLAITKAGHKLYYLNFSGVKYRIHSKSVQATRKTIYQNRFEVDRDNFFLERGVHFLPFVERSCMKIVLYRNLLIRRMFKNKFNFFIRLLSSSIGFIPTRVLNLYRARYI